MNIAETSRHNRKIFVVIRKVIRLLPEISRFVMMAHDNPQHDVVAGCGGMQRTHRVTGGELFVRTLSDEYDVSQVAALYRLQSLGFFPKDSQARLRLAD